MIDTLALLQARRSLPPVALGEPGPTSAQIETLLSIAARVPDHGKLVPWRFIVFVGAARHVAGDIIADVFAASEPGAEARRVEAERSRLARAPVVIAVVSRAAPHPKIPEWEQVLSAGAVCMNLTVAAVAMGFGASWITEWYAYDRRVLSGFGLAEHETIAGFLHIGRATLRQEDRERPILAQIVSYFPA